MREEVREGFHAGRYPPGQGGVPHPFRRLPRVRVGEQSSGGLSSTTPRQGDDFPALVVGFMRWLGTVRRRFSRVAFSTIPPRRHAHCTFGTSCTGCGAEDAGATQPAQIMT